MRRAAIPNSFVTRIVSSRADQRRDYASPRHTAKSPGDRSLRRGLVRQTTSRRKCGFKGTGRLTGSGGGVPCHAACSAQIIGPMDDLKSTGGTWKVKGKRAKFEIFLAFGPVGDLGRESVDKRLVRAIIDLLFVDTLVSALLEIGVRQSCITLHPISSWKSVSFPAELKIPGLLRELLATRS